MVLQCVDKLSDDEMVDAGPTEKVEPSSGSTKRKQSEAEAPSTPKPKSKPKAASKAKGKAQGKAKAKVTPKTLPKKKPAAQMNNAPATQEAATVAPMITCGDDDGNDAPDDDHDDGNDAPMKRPSALRKPAAATCLSANKYIYQRDGVWGIKMSGKEVCRVRGDAQTTRFFYIVWILFFALI